MKTPCVSRLEAGRKGGEQGFSFQGSTTQRPGKTSDPQLAKFIGNRLIAHNRPLGVQGMKTPASPASRRDGRVVNKGSAFRVQITQKEWRTMGLRK
ncbi:MAG TPA: hypothetical protein DEF47_13930 [Herpetosiphon sp.]|nr:hypothetical protein [Herpetosiphon sp.]